MMMTDRLDILFFSQTNPKQLQINVEASLLSESNSKRD